MPQILNAFPLLSWKSFFGVGLVSLRGLSRWGRVLRVLWNRLPPPGGSIPPASYDIGIEYMSDFLLIPPRHCLLGRNWITFTVPSIQRVWSHFPLVSLVSPLGKRDAFAKGKKRNSGNYGLISLTSEKTSDPEKIPEKMIKQQICGHLEMNKAIT